MIIRLAAKFSDLILNKNTKEYWKVVNADGDMLMIKNKKTGQIVSENANANYKDEWIPIYSNNGKETVASKNQKFY